MNHSVLPFRNEHKRRKLARCFDWEISPKACDVRVSTQHDSNDLWNFVQVVLKLCNRSRAAGVIVAPLDELDEVLEEILTPPQLLGKNVMKRDAI